MTETSHHDGVQYSMMKNAAKGVLRFPALTGDVLKALAAVEDQLADWTASDNPLIAEISAYLFKNKGKRIRPALVILTERLLGRRAEDEVFLASLMELIHTASLVHDDIVDDCDTRRGGLTVHRKWGPNVTVLLGDHLYIKAMKLAMSSGRGRITEIMADVSSGMIKGELDEYAAAGRLDIGEGAYLDVIYNKTASLFEACCRIGMILAGAGPAEEEAAASFGKNAGMAFQISDDILDLTADPDRLGKPVFSDVREGRLTLPLIHALSAGGSPTAADLEGMFGSRRDPDALQRKLILDGLEAAGSLDYARDKARGYAAAALGALSFFPDSEARTALSEVLGYIRERDI